MSALRESKDFEAANQVVVEVGRMVGSVYDVGFEEVVDSHDDLLGASFQWKGDRFCTDPQYNVTANQNSSHGDYDMFTKRDIEDMLLVVYYVLRKGGMASRSVRNYSSGINTIHSKISRRPFRNQGDDMDDQDETKVVKVCEAERGAVKYTRAPENYTEIRMCARLLRMNVSETGVLFWCLDYH